MRLEKSQKHFVVKVVMESGSTRDINVKAATRETAERRALKRTPGAVSIYRS